MVFTKTTESYDVITNDKCFPCALSVYIVQRSIHTQKTKILSLLHLLDKYTTWLYLYKPCVNNFFFFCTLNLLKWFIGSNKFD